MRVNKDIIAREIHGDTVLLNMKTGDYFSLNAVGTDIYNCINDGMNNDNIISFLIDKYDVEKEVLEADVKSIISKLTDNDILVGDGE